MMLKFEIKFEIAMKLSFFTGLSAKKAKGVEGVCVISNQIYASICQTHPNNQSENKGPTLGIKSSTQPLHK